MRAGDQAGCARVEELTLDAPLVLPADGAVTVQVTVGGPGQAAGGPSRCIPGRAGRHGPVDPARQRRAGPGRARRSRRPGGVAAGRCRPGGHRGAVRGPGRDRVRVRARVPGPAGRLAARRGRLRRGALPSGAEPGAFGLHPALLDAALHASALLPARPTRSGCRSPGPGCGCTRRAPRRSGSAAPGGSRGAVADRGGRSGAPVVTVASLSRPARRAAGRGPRDALFSVAWRAVPAPEPGTTIRLAVIGASWLGSPCASSAAPTRAVRLTRAGRPSRGRGGE